MVKKKDVVTVDRRRSDRRTQPEDRRQVNAAVETERRTASEPRRKVQRRRQIDPTTCERDYSGEEIEFMQALDAYKRANGRMFPTCSEILEVIRGLGYIKLSPEELEDLQGELTDSEAEVEAAESDENIESAEASATEEDEPAL